MRTDTPMSETRENVLARVRGELRGDMRNLRAAGVYRVGWRRVPRINDGIRVMYPIRSPRADLLTHYTRWVFNARYREARLINWITMIEVDTPRLQHVLYQAEVVPRHLLFQMHFCHNDYNLRVNLAMETTLINRYRGAHQITAVDLTKMATAVYNELRCVEDTPYRYADNASVIIEFKRYERRDRGQYYVRVDMHTSGDYEAAHPRDHPIRRMPRDLWGIVMGFMGAISR